MSDLLLSNSGLDELYAIRRILVGRYNAVHKTNDEFGMNYYESKVKAMDDAIGAFITVHKVPHEHVEQTMALKARAALRIPGENLIQPQTT